MKKSLGIFLFTTKKKHKHLKLKSKPQIVIFFIDGTNFKNEQKLRMFKY